MKIKYKREAIEFASGGIWRHTYNVLTGGFEFQFVRNVDIDMQRFMRAGILRAAHRDLWKHIHATLDAQSSHS